MRQNGSRTPRSHGRVIWMAALTLLVLQVSDTVGMTPADRNMQATRGTDVSSGPAPEYEAITRLQAGQKVRIIGQAGKWLQVEINDLTRGFVRASMREEVKGPAVGEHFRDCPECPEMVVVPAGSFMMGAPAGETYRYDSEGPVHRVRIGDRFAVGVKEVTREEYRRFVSVTGHSMGDTCVYTSGIRKRWNWENPGYEQTDGHPVVCVSWEDAKAYVRWLRERTGAGYRLLSESEWEYVARAGSSTARYWGDIRPEGESESCRYSNLMSQEWSFDPGVLSCNDGYLYTAPVGSYGANGFGLHDVLGNVWEWVEDCWHDNYRGAPNDGSAWENGDCSRRVLRGGSWSSEPWHLRSAIRIWSVAGGRSNFYGIRVARTLTP